VEGDRRTSLGVSEPKATKDRPLPTARGSLDFGESHTRKLSMATSRFTQDYNLNLFIYSFPVTAKEVHAWLQNNRKHQSRTKSVSESKNGTTSELISQEQSSCWLF
jgi:hypothetical protein